MLPHLLLRGTRHQKQLYSKKYGVHLARFTHKSSTVIYASTKENGQSAALSGLAGELISATPQTISDT